MFEKIKAKHREIDVEAKEFFKGAEERLSKVNLKKGLDFGKPKRVKKSFKSEGFKL